MSAPDGGVRVDHDGEVAVVTLDHPATLNALTAELAGQARQALASARDAAPRCLVLAGGDRAFAAGANLDDIRRQSPEQNIAYNRELRALMDDVAGFPAPVIAAVHGFALGGGLELALAATLRIGDATTRVGLPEVRLGILPGAGGVERLPRTVAAGAAARLLLTGERIDGERAARIGLLDEVAEGDARDEARTIARRIAANAPLAVGEVLGLLRRGPDVAESAIEDALLRLLRSEDVTEGMAAFAERRDPRFAGR